MYKEIENGVYLFNLRGTIGEQVNGAEIAEEIEYLNSIGAKRIIQKINSNGGYIEDGMSIINANLTSEATIETINIGVAASIAAVILATGDVRKAYDNTFAVIHDPQIAGETIENIKDEQVKNNMLKVKDTILQTLVDACKKPKKFISDLMTRETAFNAAEQKEFGLIDKVIKSRVKAPQTRNLVKVMNYFNEHPQTIEKQANNVNFRYMNLITNYLSLNPDASEESILKAIRDIKEQADNNLNNFSELNDNIEKLTNDLKAKDDELKAANDKLKAFHDQAIKNAVDNAINTGKFKEDQRDFLTEKAEKDLDFFNEMVNEMPVMHQSALETIQNNVRKQKGESDDDKGTVKDWDYYQKNDPEYLKNLELTNLNEFKKLYKDYWGVEYSITTQN